MLIDGELGIGKTALCEEPGLSLPFAPFVEAFRGYAHKPLTDQLLSSEVDVSHTDRWRLLHALTTSVRDATKIEPVILILEDLQWANRFAARAKS